MEDDLSNALSLLFDATTKPQRPVQLVVTVGTWVEYVVYQIVRQHLSFPEELFKKDKTTGVGFSTLVRLAVALGALPPDLKGVLEKFATIRNRFAHDIRTVLTSNDLNEFLRSFPDGLKSVLEQRIHSIPDFQWALLVLGQEVYRCMDDPENPTDDPPFVPEAREAYFATFIEMMRETESAQALLYPVRDTR